MVIDHSNFHIVGNDLKFTYSLELTKLSTSAKSHLFRSVDFNYSRSFKKRNTYES